jgi:uncharacterized membrane protein YedE/YeeE
MKARTIELAAAAAAGLLFGAGLLVSGLANPRKVLAFLDAAGAWDPSLAVVMLAALGVGVPGFALLGTSPRSALGLPMRLPSGSPIDRSLVAGAVIFGVGWGLAGICPGPAVVALATGSAKAFAFALAMLAGMGLFELARR